MNATKDLGQLPEGKGQPDFLNLSADTLALFKSRIAAQFEMARGHGLGGALDQVQPGPQSGLALIEVQLALNKKHDLLLSFGEFIIRSEQESGYWCNGFGWVNDPIAASGYTYPRPLAGFPEDAQFVRFASAKAFELDLA